MSVPTSQSPHCVTPDLIRGPAYFRSLLADINRAKGSWTPDQVRGDVGLLGRPAARITGEPS
jgi:hypothetical protein